ncbi:Fic/DOC family protein [Rhizobium puerariae]|uniref:protein adenylyltransferase n=1 Tax=Rhizobium puerariae TaxID=1585791 RepID=A0ABV6AJ81_9HYPH
MSGDPYVYPGTKILSNKLDIRDPAELDFAERRFSTIRARQGIPQGNFDLKHLKAIHRHLFQDLYEWAGEIRTVEISKGESQFQFRQYIETGMADVHSRLAKSGFLRGLERSAFAAEAGRIIGDVNYVHPFREGNGRTQLQYLKQLAEGAGHSLDLTKIDVVGWLAASKEAHRARYDLMGRTIDDALRMTSNA